MSKQRKKILSEIVNDTDKQENIISQLKNKEVDSNPSEEKGTVRITLDVPKPLHKKIKSYTKARGQSIKGYLLFLASQDMDD